MDKDTALKLALEALEANFATWSAKTKAIPIIKEALAQPEQKPVAWMREDEDCTDCIVWEQTEEHTIPLYTAPPRREWVGLDDEEMKELRDANFDLLYGARWAERKLREKNT